MTTEGVSETPPLSPALSPKGGKTRLFAVICLALAIGTFILYLPVRHNGFTNFDDNGYITENAHVNTGLTAANIIWAFTHSHSGYWIPLAWISHMLDCQLFGLNAGGHHLVSVLFHIANTLLLFWWLERATGMVWRSAFVAALFAWHPLHVESVAWACERKDVLSAFFWMLTLIAYTHYVKRREAAKAETPRCGVHVGYAISYLLALFLFACGLMSKPMVVTLPFVLLLLDFWPLGRLGVGSWKMGDGTAESGKEGKSQGLTESRPTFQFKAAFILLEKIPFFVLAGIGSVIGYLTQAGAGAVSGDPLSYRITNALDSYLRYLSKIFWPSDLCIFYPFLTHGMMTLAIASAVLLGVCSMAFMVLTRKWPYLFVGWFWFLGTLVPVIGVIAQAGSQSMADRFTYLPSIGMFILVTWAVADGLQKLRALVAVAAAAVLIACFAVSSIQITYWRDSITAFRRALAVTTDNYVACACLGQALDAIGDDKDALTYCQDAVRIDPDYSPGQFFLALVLWKEGDTAQAREHFNIAAKADYSNPAVQYNLGKFLLEHGLPNQAAARFAVALDDDPDFAEADNALGKTYLKQGKLRPAEEELSRAAALEPDNAQFRYDLGTVLLADAQPNPAIDQFAEAVRLQPGLAVAQENLGVALAGQGKLDEAISHFSKWVQLEPGNAEAHFNLGLAYLNHHQPAQAAEQFTEELRLAPNQTKGEYRLAQALKGQGRWAEAISHYRRALQLTSNFTEAQKELDEILAAHPELR